MEATKRYQFSASKPLSQKKPGTKRQLGLDDEVLLVSMRIRLDSPIEDLVFRFKISAGYASKIFKKLWEVFYIYIIHTYQCHTQCTSVKLPLFFVNNPFLTLSRKLFKLF